jgi:hypothetical protein
MAFWSQAASEPRRAHRFLLNLPLLTTYHQYLAKTVTKPSFTVGESEHKFLGNTYYYPGAVTWDPVTATIVNAMDPDGNETFVDALYNGGYMSPSEQEAFFGGGDAAAIGRRTTGPGSPNKADSLASLGDVIIRELNGEGFTIGIWTLKNPWITNVKFGDLDYSTEDLLNIELSFRYDWAEYQTAEGGDPVKGSSAAAESL